MATFYDKLRAKSQLYVDGLIQQDESLQMGLRHFLVHDRKQLMVVQSVTSYQTVKDILRNYPNLGTKVKAKYSDPTCLTWEQCREVVKTSKMILTLPKLMILDYDKSDFDSDDSKLLKILLERNSVHPGTANKIVVVLSAATEDLKYNFESLLGETCVKLELSEQKLNLKHRNEEQKATSLIEAAFLGNYYQVMRFIDNDTNINLVDRNKNTALHHAADAGHNEVVLFLLQHGAAQLCNNMRRYPLHLACCNGHNDIVTILIEYGADLKKKDALGQTALNCATCGNHPHIVETLLQYGAEVDDVNSKSETSLHIAASMDLLEIVKILIKYGASHTLLNGNYQTAAQIALEKGFKHIADYLKDEEHQKKELKNCSQ